MKFNLFLSMGKKTTIVDFHALPYVSKVALQMNPPYCTWWWSLVALEREVDESGHLDEGLRVDAADAVVVQQQAPQQREPEGVVLHGGDTVETGFGTFHFVSVQEVPDIRSTTIRSSKVHFELTNMNNHEFMSLLKWVQDSSLRTFEKNIWDFEWVANQRGEGRKGRDFKF